MSLLSLKNILQSAHTAGFFLSRGVIVHGNINAATAGRIDGTVMGDIVAEDKLVIGETGVVNGNIDASDLLVFGTVEGDISSSKKAVIANTARIRGKLNCPVLDIAEGAQVEEARIQHKKTRPKSIAPLKSGPVTGVQKGVPQEEDSIESWF